MAKRLFLFAAYDAHGYVDDALVYYVRALSHLGDVVLVMDADAPDSEIQKLAPYVLYASATRHGEYDFGSYKRAYTYARDANILDNYEFVYMVNDSVYGPLYDLKPILSEIESRNLDAWGIVCNPHRRHPHIQSWFIGCRKSVFTSKWFDAFMMRIKRQSDKGAITFLYEQGFTKQIIDRKLTWGCTYNVGGRGVYNNVQKLYRRGMPFMKKNAFVRTHGALGGQIMYVLRHIAPDLRHAIISSARHTYGDAYISWLLTRNPIKITIRHLHHAAVKIFSGKL